MKIDCIHGFFIFSEFDEGQINDFSQLTGIKIGKRGEQYTFNDLAEVPEFSILGVTFMGNVATKNYEGSAGELFEQNGLIYNFTTGLVVPIASITQRTKIYSAGNVMLSPGLIIPGSFDENSRRVKGYSAWFNREGIKFTYSSISYV